MAKTANGQKNRWKQQITTATFSDSPFNDALALRISVEKNADGLRETHFEVPNHTQNRTVSS